MVQSTVSSTETIRNHPDTEIVAKHTPTPWDYIASTEHHGPYITSSVGGTIADLYLMTHPSEPSTANGGRSKPVSFYHEMADPNAAFIVQAVNSHDALVASLREMLSIYWGEGDGQEPPPSCIQRAQRALS